MRSSNTLTPVGFKEDTEEERRVRNADREEDRQDKIIDDE
jgi:hypothetical protein